MAASARVVIQRCRCGAIGWDDGNFSDRDNDGKCKRNNDGPHDYEQVASGQETQQEYDRMKRQNKLFCAKLLMISETLNATDLLTICYGMFGALFDEQIDMILDVMILDVQQIIFAFCDYKTCLFILWAIYKMDKPQNMHDLFNFFRRKLMNVTSELFENCIGNKQDLNDISRLNKSTVYTLKVAIKKSYNKSDQSNIKRAAVQNGVRGYAKLFGEENDMFLYSVIFQAEKQRLSLFVRDLKSEYGFIASDDCVHIEFCRIFKQFSIHKPDDKFPRKVSEYNEKERIGGGLAEFPISSEDKTDLISTTSSDLIDIMNEERRIEKVIQLSNPTKLLEVTKKKSLAEFQQKQEQLLQQAMECSIKSNLV